MEGKQEEKEGSHLEQFVNNAGTLPCENVRLKPLAAKSKCLFDATLGQLWFNLTIIASSVGLNVLIALNMPGWFLVFANVGACFIIPISFISVDTSKLRLVADMRNCYLALMVFASMACTVRIAEVRLICHCFTLITPHWFISRSTLFWRQSPLHLRYLP